MKGHNDRDYWSKWTFRATRNRGISRESTSKQIIAAVRSPEKASSFGMLGVQVREADYTRPETLSTAFHSVRMVLLISASEVGRRFEKHKAVIDAAKEVGVEQLVYTSLLHAARSEMFLAKSTNKQKSTFELPAYRL